MKSNYSLLRTKTVNTPNHHNNNIIEIMPLTESNLQSSLSNFKNMRKIPLRKNYQKQLDTVVKAKKKGDKKDNVDWF